MKNTTKGFLVVFTLFCVVVASCAMCGGGESLPDNLTAEERFIAEIVGYKTNHESHPVKIVSVSLSAGALEATLIGSNSLSTEWAKRSMFADSRDIFAAAFDKHPEVQRIFLRWQYPLVDKLGNEKLGEVIKIGINRETAESVNWENFDTDNFPDVADSYWQHPVLD